MINPGTMASPAPIAVQRATILQVVPRLDSGGAEQSTLEIVEAIVRAGGRALVATAGGRMVDAVVGAGGEVVQMPVATKNPALMLLNVQRLVALIRRERIALIHARSRAPAWCALLAARRTGVAFVTTVHGLHAERGPLKRAYNGVMARGDCVIANSEFTAAGVRARYGVTESRLRVIPRGFDPAPIQATSSSREPMIGLGSPSWRVDMKNPRTVSRVDTASRHSGATDYCVGRPADKDQIRVDCIGPPA